ncbi:MAG: glycogen/starch/alpha-glucan phosphorylase [Promicromonosporaceae bacterium]|nr:glycogen/starch/alpha-glucan phosphorylase [Promicromonosporaceae bacterium]
MTELAPTLATSPEPTVEGFAAQYLRSLTYTQGTTMELASPNDKYQALADTARAYLMDRWNRTRSRQQHRGARGVAYLSAEYLLGRQLDNALLSCGLTDIARDAMASLGLNIDDLRALEPEPGLGNGGLGRLAACFIDSLATLSIPAIGYGIRYEYGIFRQTWVDGRQVEEADNWLDNGSPWEVARPDQVQIVNFGGRVEHDGDKATWIPEFSVRAIPFNYMVPGYQNGRVNTLRLWSARATKEFDLQIFNNGDYVDAVRARTFAENITKVLYPEDSTPQGKELRLQQQYFFVSASLYDFIDRLMGEGVEPSTLPDRVTFQLNDTHPVIGIPELMRILVDERGFTWDDAWDITQRSFAYTCHTLLPEALEVWPVALMEKLLPRHMEIIYRINEQFLTQVRAKYGNDEMLIRRMSIIAEYPERAVRMAHLAAVGTRAINGVAELHSQLLREKVFHDFAELNPEKFTNVTNGITPRRFLSLSNPSLSGLITEAIGDGWITDLSQLSRLEPLADDADFRRRVRDIKSANKQKLVGFLKERDGVDLEAGSMFDVMIKRMHEYKRQMLKVLHVVSMYDDLKSGRVSPDDMLHRTVVFGAKAAPGYVMAKEIIALIKHVEAVVNAHPVASRALRISFPANYNVTVAETLIPAADLSEQISLAGQEASGTGNMKFALNGALTIGTDDGANVEIRKLVGDDNFFLFGMNEPEVSALRDSGYNPQSFYEGNETLRRAMELIASGEFSDGNRQMFESIVSNLLYEDRFMVLADFESYLTQQAAVEAYYRDQEAWSRSAILNIARTGFFSSDRSIQDYLDRIWFAPAVEIPA